ncbi:hypothetical protein DLAC_02702 [Tieghemostelium lacteum]|uniref:Terpene synthase n=1 Tax=Tieghemostelium lacteum TaxID=361077 RepID=A0A152A344_TIELA|nr:hypothetical protein DLAC_02702 [Tieghemostelium lacteum]|eukprot:KYR00668.1 hypothetical protein DLAC_02702 [Tieghemostelium lacteum]
MDSWDYKLYSNQLYKVPDVVFKIEINTSLCADKLPISDEIENNHLKWLNDSKFYGDVPVTNTLNSLVPYIYSFLPEKYIIPMYRVVDWVTIFDDLVLENKNYTPEYLESIFNRNAIHDHFGKSYWKILDEFDNIDVPRELMNDIMRKYVKSIIKSFSVNLRDSTFNEYFKIRRKTSGSKVFLSTFLLDLKCNNIASTIMVNPLVERLCILISNCNSLLNDLYSFVKEFQSEEYDNYVKVLCYQLTKDLTYPYTTDIIQTSMNKIKDIIESSYEEAAEIGELIKNHSEWNQEEHTILEIILKRIYESAYGHILTYKNTFRYISNH